MATRVRRSGSSGEGRGWRALRLAARGCTFDDFLLAPQFSVLSRRDPSAIDLSCRFSTTIQLRRPIVSANMDTVTRAPMAIVQAEEGGLGVIDRGFRPGDIEPQVVEVAAVKRTQHLVIADPYTIDPGASVADGMALMEHRKVGTLVVVDAGHRLVGLLTQRDVRFLETTPPGKRGTVADRMTPVARLVVHVGTLSPERAERLMVDHKVKKLPLTNRAGVLKGLITAKDLLHLKRLPFATRDAVGRLRVGAAIGATGDYLERGAELVKAGVDCIVIDIAHGHSVVMANALEQFRKRFPDVDLVAGNVATAEGALFLAERGVNAIKVGIGPGGGCTTRITTSFGVPQLQALVECRTAVGPDLPIIADGGVRRDGSIAEALLFGGDTVMLGSAFAGTAEAPGEIVQKPVVLPESQKVVQVPFKVLRGMASIQAIKDRLDVEDADQLDLEALGAEGMEVSVPARGTARLVVQDMLKHLCSSISYGGARSLSEFREQFRRHPDRYLIRLSAAGRRESYER
jgi:IMP dehydrogenase